MSLITGIIILLYLWVTYIFGCAKKNNNGLEFNYGKLNQATSPRLTEIQKCPLSPEENQHNSWHPGGG